MNEPLIPCLGIIGLGLIGGSVAAAARREGIAGQVMAWDMSEHALNLGRDLGLIDEIAADITALQGADVVLVAVPVMAVADVLAQLPLSDQILTDVGSVKSSFIDAVRQTYGHLPGGLVPGHPIAGSEKHGVIAADPDLFQNHRVILTPVEESRNAAVEMVSNLTAN